MLQYASRHRVLTASRSAVHEPLRLHLDSLVHKPCTLVDDLPCAQRIVPDLQHVRNSGHEQT